MVNTVFKNIILQSFLVILLSSSISSTDYTCLETSVCVCKLDDYQFIDLTKLKTNDALKETALNLTYFFYPCQDVLFDAKKYNLNVTDAVGNDCAKGTSLCLYNATDNSLTNLGQVKDGKFLNDFPKTWKFSSASRETSILVECAPEMEHPKFVYENSTHNNHVLYLFSKYSCMVRAHPGLSIGSTLLILCGTIFGVYLIGGVLILHCLRGARGTEMIPNIDFWGSLPGLVKDGVIFLLGGCNPMVIASAETYDKI